MINKSIPRILLIDREPRWSQEVKTVLEEQGEYKVESVADIDTALSFPRGNGFDLILVNAVLAFGGDASKFKEILRLYPDRVLVISDVRSITTAIRVFKMGADYAEKPFEPRRVIELVSSHLQPACSIVS